MKKANLPFIIAAVYNGALLLWFGLNRLTGDHFWWMVPLNYVAPYLFTPALPLAGLVALPPGRRRLGQAASVGVIPLFIFQLLYWPYVIPRPATGNATPVLRVMTYNILYSNADYAAIAAVIRTQNPDLVALQEVQPAAMAALQSRLRVQYPYSLMATPHPYGTTAIFSRHALLDAYTVDLQTDRAATVVKIEIAGQEVTLASAHLLAFGLQWIPWAEWPAAIQQRVADQNRQASILLARLREEVGPVILACDCNSKEVSSTYHILQQTLRNVARAVGWRPGQPSRNGVAQDRGLQHIDYIFYRGATLQPVSFYKVTDTGGSDHLPRVANFVLGDNN
jgi:vancomycin resistance protein VanJ